MIVGSARPEHDIAPQQFRTKVQVAYPQGQNDRCLFLCVASALHYMGLEEEAAKLAALGSKAEHVSGSTGIDELRESMIVCAPIVGRPMLFNTSKKKRKRPIHLKEIVTQLTPYPTLIIPLGADRSVNHAICVVDNLIFDSTQSFAMKCQVDAIGWICNCGKKGVADVFEAMRFQYPINCSPLDRMVVNNWKK